MKMKFNKKLIISYALLVAWALVIFILSSEGHEASSGRSDLIVEYVKAVSGSNLSQDVLTFITRKAAHTIAYFIFGILAYNVIRQYKLTGRRTVLVSTAIVLGYALSDEFHQLFVPGRSGELRDVLIDTTAGVGGVLLMRALYLTSRRQSRKTSK